MYGRKQLSVLGGILLIGILIAGISVGLILNKKEEIKLFRGGVVTNGYECATIGRDILAKDGSAADAAIAALLCEGVAMPQSTGIGGGFLLTIYTKSTGIVETLNAREAAPLAATQDMFDKNSSLSSTGGKAVAVPGELRGYEELWKKYGKLPWKEIIQPTIDLCKSGHYVTDFFENMLTSNKANILKSESLSAIYIDPKTGDTYKVGQRIKRPTLAKTLEVIAKEGANALYDGSLTKGFVQDIINYDGIITEEDMKLYKAEWEPPIVEDLPNDQKLYSMPLPGSGLILNFIMGICRNFLDTSNMNTVKNWQKIIESMKYGYGKRTELGDHKYVEGIEEIITNLTNSDYINSFKDLIFDDQTFQDPEHYGANFSNTEDHGTAHISILAPNGDAVSVTGTINLIFGAKIVSQSTGIILNDEMDDFSSSFPNSFGLPPSPANYIEPQKRPLSSMSPSIVVNKDGTVRLVIGAAGGSKITTSMALVIMKHLWFGESLKQSIHDKRAHHQLFPMSITFEEGFNKDVVQGLSDIGHKYEVLDPHSGFAAVTGISNSADGIMEIVSDPRRSGSEIYI